MKRFKNCEKTALSKASVKQGLQHPGAFHRLTVLGCFALSLSQHHDKSNRQTDNGCLSPMLHSAWEIYRVQLLCNLLKANTILLRLWSKQNGKLLVQCQDQANTQCILSGFKAEKQTRIYLQDTLDTDRVWRKTSCKCSKWNRFTFATAASIAQLRTTTTS